MNFVINLKIMKIYSRNLKLNVWTRCPLEALIDSRTLKKRFALIARTEIQQTQEL